MQPHPSLPQSSLAHSSLAGAASSVPAALSGTSLTRRHLLLGAAGLGAVAITGTLTRPAHAALLLDPDPIRSYELAWERTNTGVQHNEAGWLAWGVSYILLSLVRMYQATGDTIYLDRFVERADEVWNQTDHARGVTDWDGRSGWVWRGGGNYTAAATVIGDSAGTDLFEVRYASAGAVTATVTVSATGAGTADLTLTHPTTGTVTLPGVSLDPSSPDFVVTRVNQEAYLPGRRWTAKWLGGSPSATPSEGTATLAQRYYAFAVHTGMVTYPMALFARVVLEQQLRGYLPTARQYVAQVQRSVEYHDREWHWRTLADGSTGGDYVWPKGAPLSFDGLIQPFNQTQGLGKTMAELHRIQPRPQWAHKVQAMVRAFRADLEPVGNAVQWHYWPTYCELFNGYPIESGLSEYTPRYGRVTSYEDVSHAAISVEFMVAAHRAGLGATEADLERLARTYLDQLRNGPEHVFTRVDGSTPATDSYTAQVGRWLALQPWGTEMVDHVRAVYEAIALEPVAGSNLAGIGYVAWATAGGWAQD